MSLLYSVEEIAIIERQRKFDIHELFLNLMEAYVDVLPDSAHGVKYDHLGINCTVFDFLNKMLAYHEKRVQALGAINANELTENELRKSKQQYIFAKRDYDLMKLSVAYVHYHLYEHTEMSKLIVNTDNKRLELLNELVLQTSDESSTYLAMMLKMTNEIQNLKKEIKVLKNDKQLILNIIEQNKDGK